jgi:hypothetical protein
MMAIAAPSTMPYRPPVIVAARIGEKMQMVGHWAGAKNSVAEPFCMII